jgi:hypothetical protein
MNSHFLSRSAITASLLALAVQTHAGTVDLDAVNSGAYNIYGYRLGASNPDPTKVTIVALRNNYVNWLGFDLSSVSDTILSATLQVESHPSNAGGQSIAWHAISTPYSDLGTVDDITISNDIQSGTLFASGTHTNGTINAFALNGDAIASLNAATSLWAVGGSVASGDGFAFGYAGGVAGGEHLRLVLETDSMPPVPIPGAVWLFVSALGAFGYFGRRRAGT